jgi:predicted transcriptional regulator
MAVHDAPVTDKQFVAEALRRMPEEATLQEISEEIAILASIRRGEAAAEAGKVISHEEVKRRSATWTSK